MNCSCKFRKSFSQRLSKGAFDKKQVLTVSFELFDLAGSQSTVSI